MDHQAHRTDDAIATDVLDELRWDTRVDATNISVDVQQSVVTLRGTVDSWSARHAAQAAAHRVRGVHDVASEIRVVLAGMHERSDTDLAQAVRRMLEWDTRIPSDRIQSTVSNGVVTLEGTVEYAHQYADAARCVRDLTGVRELRNWIKIEPTDNTIEPADLRAAIEAALKRHAHRAAEHLQIGIVDGRVILCGSVGSWAERCAIEGVVRGTPGVSEVDNQMRQTLL